MSSLAFLGVRGVGGFPPKDPDTDTNVGLHGLTSERGRMVIVGSSLMQSKKWRSFVSVVDIVD